MNTVLNLIDLFSGCGGFSLGAELAGFHTHAAIDIDEDLQSTYQTNFPNTHVINGDLAEFSSQAWKFIISDKSIDGVIGGPPCQGFSRMGKKDILDPRNNLVSHYFRHVKSISPKFFIMENVEGILDNGSKDILLNAMKLVSDEYEILGPVVLNTADFGAPTLRKRVIVIGYKKNFISEITLEDLVPQVLENVSVKDAISDLPSPIATNKENIYGWAKYKSKAASKYAKSMRSVPNKEIGWDLAKLKIKENEISGNFETLHTKDVIERFSDVLPGKQDTISKFPRLDWKGKCPTLRAGTGSDKGSYQAARPIHPNENRVITVREAARLQGFPDWFTFHRTKWHSFRMIGNSVSPILSYFLLNMIKRKIKEQNNDSFIEYI